MANIGRTDDERTLRFLEDEGKKEPLYETS